MAYALDCKPSHDGSIPSLESKLRRSSLNGKAPDLKSESTRKCNGGSNPALLRQDNGSMTEWKCAALLKRVHRKVTEVRPFLLPPLFLRGFMTDSEYKKTNREKSREPRGHSFWCDKCDKDLVMAGQKCGVCGYKNGKKRDKHKA